MSLSDAFWVVLGSLVIAAGSTIAGLYAFEGRVALVMAGFLLFTWGYQLSQHGVHRGGIRFGGLETSRLIRRATLLVIGWIGIAFGVTLFAQTILDPSLSNAAFSGVSSIGGYMFAHVGINGVGLGHSLIGGTIDDLEQRLGGDSER
ncbi:hypothetical protein [Haloarchaeobius amylolyticus]|uniref:hypothetical protein n=1 Tax=Haloarchaeobius amylolyticus TaxID=1198296 RepID=UPI00226EEF12|nr:hypothetical protein [Haloarchaeobius amylolyticus]